MESQKEKTIEQIALSYFSMLNDRFSQSDSDSFGGVDQCMFLYAEILKIFNGHQINTIEASIKFVLLFPDKFNTTQKHMDGVYEILTILEKSCTNQESIPVASEIFKVLKDKFSSSDYFTDKIISRRLFVDIVMLCQSEKPEWQLPMFRNR